ncbi:MAG: TIGR01440 family protein [Acutalibacteraceae bacterium]
MELEAIKNQAEKAVCELIEKAKLQKGQLLVIGCSSSEIVGQTIGHGSSLEAAQAVFAAVYPKLQEKGIYLAAQCCEHLNRALILEREAAEKFGYEIVNVYPQPKAGGSFATTAYENFNQPVAVEHIKADAGLDIGLTLIGMHLKDVAVPLRLSIDKIGQAHITAARTRPKFIGGVRAHYNEDLL